MPSATDPSVAPAGRENLFVLIPVSPDAVDGTSVGAGGIDGAGDPAVERAVDDAIAQMADWAGVPDLAERVLGLSADEWDEEAPVLTPAQNTNYLVGSFLLSAVWSLGATLNADYRVKFDNFLRNLLAGNDEQFPLPKSIKLNKQKTLRRIHFNFRTEFAFAPSHF